MIYQLEAERRFPVESNGLRAVGWIEGEVQDWLAVRIEAAILPSPISQSRA